MPELFASSDAFAQEDRRGGELDGGVDGERVGWRATAGPASRISSSRQNSSPPRTVD